MRMMIMLALGLAPAPLQGQDRTLRPLVTEDYLKVRGLQDIQASPSGGLAVIQIGVVDTVKDEYVSDLWTLDPETGDLRQLTLGEGSEYSARFSPDGSRIAFLAAAGEWTQVFAIPPAGGQPELLFSFSADVEEFAWFPDGQLMAFIAKDPEPAEAASRREQVIQYDREYYKVNDSGFLDNRYAHLWIADLATGNTRMIGGGNFDYASPAVSPDGRWIAFASNRTANRDRNRNSDIHVVGADGGSLIQVSRAPGSADRPEWSPDGSRLAYLEQSILNNYGAHANLWVTDVQAAGERIRFGAPRNLTASLDRSVAEGSYTEGGSPYPRWSRDGRTIFIGVEDSARVHLYRIDARTGARQLVVGGNQMVEFATPLDDGILLGLATDSTLSDVFRVRLNGRDPNRLTTLNEAWFSTVQKLPIERLRFRSTDGTMVEGFVVKPPGFTAGQAYPTILGIHGGPQWFYGAAFNMLFQIAAGRGYLAVYLNPRGSTSYGRHFMDLVGPRYGHGDDPDFLTALDTLVKRGWADSTNLFVMGNSYGGIATNWLITQTGRFRAAASSSGVSDYTASFGVDDDAIEWIAAMGGPPWEVADRYRAQSPMMHVDRVTTPTIFLHGALDYICPVGESERMYLALTLRGVESKLVIFPEENHNFDARASSYGLRNRLILDWFDAHRSR